MAGQQDQSGGSASNESLPPGNQISLDAGSHSFKGLHQNEQFASGDDYAPKARKAYTITKQRERWTEEEHKKFLEALKMYGRVWRRIEEHVGTKSAVQIRSHAQKFFSKVVRESSTNDASSVKPIEIPPPRPKRKPIHPYPRKVVTPLKIGNSNTEQLRGSTSPNLSPSEPENQSPTSVLSAIGSDTQGTMDSTPNGCLSPVSSAAGVKHGGCFLSEPSLSPEENGSLSLGQINANSSPDYKIAMKVESFPQDDNLGKESSTEATSTQSLKLFGKTVLVTDSHIPSPTTSSSKSLLPEINDRKPVQTLPWNLMHTSALPCGVPAALYYVQLPNETSGLAEAGSAPLPWWNFFGGVPFPYSQMHTAVPMKAYLSSDDSKETEHKEIKKEGSWTGSNTGSVNAGEDGDKNWDVETQSRQLSSSSDKEEIMQKLTLAIKPSEKADFPVQITNPSKFLKGFVPYKRCLAERDSQLSTVTGEERDEKRICLCL